MMYCMSLSFQFQFFVYFKIWGVVLPCTAKKALYASARCSPEILASVKSLLLPILLCLKYKPKGFSLFVTKLSLYKYKIFVAENKLKFFSIEIFVEVFWFLKL